MTQHGGLSFMKSLFFGLLRPELVHPFPRQTEEERETTRMILESYREFAEAHLDGGRFDREHAVPKEIREQLAELGILGLTIPEEHGGAGLGYTTYCRVMEETNRHCASTAVILGGHQSIGIKALLLHGNETQKREWLPKLATGEWMAAYALSEPQAGSDPASLQTRADEQPDGSYLLTGQKIWCTNGGFAEFVTVFAKTDDGAGGLKVTCFVVTPAEMAHGFRRGAEEKKLGLRGSSTTQLFFDQCRVPASSILGEKGKGLKVAFEVLNYGRTSLAAGCAGASKRVLEEAARHARERVQFGRPIADFELVQEKLAEMASDIYSVETIAYLTTAMADRGEDDFSLEAAACKVFATEAHWRVANHGVQIAGGIAYVEEYPYERFLRDARINMIFEGTNEILHHFIAMNGLKAPGQALAELGRATQDFGPGTLFDYAHAHFPSTAGDGSRFPGVSEELAEEVHEAEQAVRILGDETAAALVAHGRAIADRELVQERLAQAAMNLYVAFACLSRCDAGLRSGGLDARSDETAVARRAIRDALARTRRSLAAMGSNDDDLTRRVAKIATAQGDGWAFGLVP
jgi:acyl-CoA dehydrogenase family protein 9